MTQLNIHSTWAGLGGPFSRIDHRTSHYTNCECKCCAPAITCEDDARAAGYTRLVYAECDMHDGVYLIKPDADLDDVVTGWCDDTQKFVKLNGWNWTFSDA